MSFEFKLPDIGEGVSEGEIVKWLVQAGDDVQEDQPIVEVMTDKATVEIASPKAGKIEKLLAKDGEMVQVGKGLVLIQDASGKSEAKAPAPEQASTNGRSNPEPAARPAPQNASNGSQEVTNEASKQVLASPATRKFAREHGLELSSIEGTGEMGRVTKEDVERMISSGSSTMTAAVSAGKPEPAAVKTQKPLEIPRRNTEASKNEEERIPVRGIRKKIVENMRKSVDHAAHFTHMDELDATRLVDLRNELKGDAEKYGVKLNYLPFVVKATTLALKKFPRLNASLDEETNEIVVKKYFNIGIAVATKDEDLVVPVIHHADQKSLLEIAEEIKTLADKAQTNKLAPADFQDGTFTITSLGPLAGTYATPIINYPEVGILGFFAIKERPVVIDGEITVRHMTNIAVSLDHRIVDGVLGAKFSKALIEYLENPGLMLLHSA